MSVKGEASISVTLDELEALIRKVVREELARALAQKPEIFYIEPGSPLYEDLQELLKHKAEGQIKLYSHDEV
ncbi:MAG: hypothetical protein ACUVV0_07625 [Anaerolineae bacterium]